MIKFITIYMLYWLNAIDLEFMHYRNEIKGFFNTKQQSLSHIIAVAKKKGKWMSLWDIC